MLIKITAESWIGHIWPLILIKAFCFFQTIFIYVEDKAFIICIAFHGFGWDSKQLIAHTEQTTKRQNIIRHTIIFRVEHDIFYMAEAFTLGIFYVIATQC